MSQMSFDEHSQRYLLPLAKALGLAFAEKRVEGSWGEHSASSPLARLTLECDRGLYWLSVGSSSQDQLWSIDQVSELFPRVRQSRLGHQRLSLDDQVEFILAHWAEIEMLFSAENAAETNKRLMSVGR